MKKIQIAFLRTVIVFIGIGALALLLWEPHFEGRNANATFFQVYFNDPFLAYAYAASLAFFVALYQAFKLLGNIGRDAVFSERSVKALRTIKRCALILVAALAGAEAYFLIVMRGKDDIAGGVAMGLLMILLSLIVAAAAAVFERTVQSAVDTKSGNSLLV